MNRREFGKRAARQSCIVLAASSLIASDAPPTNRCGRSRSQAGAIRRMSRPWTWSFRRQPPESAPWTRRTGGTMSRRGRGLSSAPSCRVGSIRLIYSR
jgi:hypothetical protein